MSSRSLCALLATIALVSCSSGVIRKPEDQRWNELRAQWESIEAIRSAHPVPETGRRDQVETLVRRQKRLEPLYGRFIAALREYAQETADPRAISMFTRERILIGDEYAEYLGRHDRAIEVYRSALRIDPGNDVIRERIERAKDRLFVSITLFNRIRSGMRTGEIVDLIGYPRVDWVKETVRNGRVYTVWIYPREEGGAAAVYFDNGVVYHKRWDAAPANGGS